MISVAMASYNGEKYLKEQLDSILNQTYQDFELIICDDCSTDSTWAILLEYAETDKRIRCYKNDKNMGFKKNFEKAIKLCSGEYVALSDQDDIWMPKHLEILYATIGSNAVCCADPFLIDEFGQQTGSTLGQFFGSELLDTRDKKLIRILYGGNPYQGASMLLHNESLQHYMPIPESISFHDVWFALCALVHDSFIYTNANLSYYRQHSHSITKRDTWSFVHSIKNMGRIREHFSDRMEYIEALQNHFKNIDVHVSDFLQQTACYYINRMNHFTRLKNIPFWIKNYTYIYCTNSKKLLIIRLIKYIFF